MDLLLRWLLTFWTVLLIYLPKQAEVYAIRDHHVRISEIGAIEKETYAVLFYLPDCFSCRAVLDYILQSRVYLVVDLYYLNMGEKEYLSYRSEEKSFPRLRFCLFPAPVARGSKVSMRCIFIWKR